jgi:hypothetical protein
LPRCLDRRGISEAVICEIICCSVRRDG